MYRYICANPAHSLTLALPNIFDFSMRSICFGRSDFDRVANALWSEPQAALRRGDDCSPSLRPSVSVAEGGAEGGVEGGGACSFPPAAAALVARVRWVSLFY